jgi:xanthine/uracil permease
MTLLFFVSCIAIAIAVIVGYLLFLIMKDDDGH